MRLKFDVIVSKSKFSTTEHKTLEDAIACEDILVRGNEFVLGKEVSLRLSIGRLDKNGVEIFAGDIVGLAPYANCELSTGIVCWSEHDAGFEVKAIQIGNAWTADNHLFSNRFYGYNGAEFIWEDLEVIGNIHSNPELLEVRK